MGELNSAFLWVNKLSTIQAPLRETKTWEEMLSNPIEGETLSGWVLETNYNQEGKL